MSIYLDNAASTKVDSDIIQSMHTYFTEKYANPVAIHEAGEQIYNEIEEMKSEILQYVKADNHDLIFTSGATESNNFFLQGITQAQKEKGDHIIISNIEHSSVFKQAKVLEKQGFKVDYAEVDTNGQVKLEELKNKIMDNTILISIMAVNNEIGSIQPLEEIGKIAQEHNIIFHSDATQAVGHIELNMEKFNLDAVTISAHKIHGPKGVGVAIYQPDLKIKPLISGTGQNGLRAGTLNTGGIVGIYEAIKKANQNLKQESELKEIKKYFYEQVSNKIDKVSINGSFDTQTSHIINLCFEGIEGEAVLLDLSHKSIYVSTGSACSSKNLQASRVIQALQVEEKYLNSNVRFSFSKYTTKSEIDSTVEALQETVERLRSFTPIK